MKQLGKVLLLTITLVLLGAGMALAQQATQPPDVVTGILLWILGQSATISLVVSALKRNPFVSAHPRLTAALLNGLAAVAEVYLVGVLPGGALVTFLTAVAAQFGATGFYENVVKPGVTFIMPPKS